VSLLHQGKKLKRISHNCKKKVKQKKKYAGSESTPYINRGIRAYLQHCFGNCPTGIDHKMGVHDAAAVGWQPLAAS